jgi:hypothetical protein
VTGVQTCALPILVIVLETTDLVLAVDSIPAVFGVTRDPFIVYSSNVCAILGLRALYFLLAGTLQYFQYLDEGLALTVMFIGAKMLAAPWVHISTGLSLAIVGGIIALAILISIIKAKMQMKDRPGKTHTDYTYAFNPIPVTPELISRLADRDPAERAWTASQLFGAGLARLFDSLKTWQEDKDFQKLLIRKNSGSDIPMVPFFASLTVGIAVIPETFEKIRAANGSVPLADAPTDQDVLEFELDFNDSGLPHVRLDILTTKAPGGNGAIAFPRKIWRGNSAGRNRCYGCGPRHGNSAHAFRHPAHFSRHARRSEWRPRKFFPGHRIGQSKATCRTS